MDISNIQASNAYTTNKTAPQPVEETLLKSQTTEAALTDLNVKDTQAAQQAFNVNITQEAQDRLAAEKTQLPPVLAAGSGQNPEPAPQSAPAQATNQIVNIVA